MKQRITQEQFEELTSAQRTAYIAWAVTKPDQSIAYRSIGHLIWFLDEHIPEGWWHVEREGSKAGWRIQHKYLDFDEQDMPELVDALWEAVKAVLSAQETPDA